MLLTRQHPLVAAVLAALICLAGLWSPTTVANRASDPPPPVQLAVIQQAAHLQRRRRYTRVRALLAWRTRAARQNRERTPPPRVGVRSRLAICGPSARGPPNGNRQMRRATGRTRSRPVVVVDGTRAGYEAAGTVKPDA